MEKKATFSVAIDVYFKTRPDQILFPVDAAVSENLTEEFNKKATSGLLPSSLPLNMGSRKKY